MMSSAKRPNLKEVVSVAPGPYPVGNTSTKNNQGSTASLGNDLNKRQPSQLAMAGSLNLLGMASAKGSAGQVSIAQQQIDDDRLKKVMINMEKDKALQFR